MAECVCTGPFIPPLVNKTQLNMLDGISSRLLNTDNCAVESDFAASAAANVGELAAAAATELLRHHCDAIMTGGGRFELHNGNQCRWVGWGGRTLVYLVSPLLYSLLISCRFSRQSGCGKQKWDSCVVGGKGGGWRTKRAGLFLPCCCFRLIGDQSPHIWEETRLHPDEFHGNKGKEGWC